MKILILASSSFAATGLPESLTAAGHEVWTFNRSAIPKATAHDLAGNYDQLGAITTQAMTSCDVLINYAIVKNGTIEQNIAMADAVMDAARRLEVKRFIHISSISVLPSITGTINENAVAVEARWKGIYSRVKASVEAHVVKHWTHAELDVVRPGFILAQGLVDSMVGTGMRLPTGHVLGLGNRHTVIMLVHRDTVNAALMKMAAMPLQEGFRRKTFMLVAPNAPTRQEYLAFHCQQMGRGWSTLHVPAWLWRVGLACGSPLLSLLKRRPFRLVKLFEHNLNVRQYDCARTAAELELDMAFDWQQALCNLVHVQPSPVWPGQHQPTAAHPKATRLGYIGMGRIVMQKHLPGLRRIGFTGELSWSDPALKEAPQDVGLNISSTPGIHPKTTHAVISTPWTARRQVIASLPPTVTHVLLEKPLAVRREQLVEMHTLLAGRHAAVLHNYRFKPNVLRYREFLKRHPSGALRAVSLHYETPSPANEQSAWMKQERRHRILLCDYAMHYLDLTWLLCEGEMQVHRCGVRFNDRDELETLSAAMSFNDVSCDVLVRSGCHQRQCIITHHFQNYSAELRFFPDVFTPMVGGKGMIDDFKLGCTGLISTGGKVLEKLGLCTLDRSHDQVLAAFTGGGDPSIINELSVTSLLPFYQRLTTLADMVYE